MFEATSTGQSGSPRNFGVEIRDILSGSLPSSLQAEPLKSLKPVIALARSGDWEAFDQEPRKAKMFALLSIIIDSWWVNEVSQYRTQFPQVHGLATFEQNARGTFVRPLSDTEWNSLVAAPKFNREYAASQCQITAMLASTTLLEARLSKPEGDIPLPDGRGARQLFLKLADEEVPGVSMEPGFLIQVLRTGFENATFVLWGFDSKATKEVVTAVALSHGASFEVLREMFNAAQQAGDSSALSEPAAIIESLRRAAASPQVMGKMRRTLRENAALNNSSYHPQTYGCPAFYSAAFNGMIDWVEEVKQALNDAQRSDS